MHKPLEYRQFTEHEDGTAYHVQQWGTERTYLEQQAGALGLIVADKSPGGPVDIYLDVDQVRELYQVLGFFLAAAASGSVREVGG